MFSYFSKVRLFKPQIYRIFTQTPRKIFAKIGIFRNLIRISNRQIPTISPSKSNALQKKKEEQT